MSGTGAASAYLPHVASYIQPSCTNKLHISTHTFSRVYTFWQELELRSEFGVTFLVKCKLIGTNRVRILDLLEIFVYTLEVIDAKIVIYRFFCR